MKIDTAKQKNAAWLKIRINDYEARTKQDTTVIVGTTQQIVSLWRRLVRDTNRFGSDIAEVVGTVVVYNLDREGVAESEEVRRFMEIYHDTNLNPNGNYPPHVVGN